MNRQKLNIKNNVALRIDQTDKFKMSRLSIAFIYDADKVESPKKMLTFSTLMRGSKNYPTVTKINCALDDLYGSTVLYRYSSDGDRHTFTFICEMLEQKYIPSDDRMDIIGGTLKILSDILFNPLFDSDGMFISEYVDSEKAIAIDNIRAKINDQRAYASSKCKKLLYDGAPCGISVDGDEETVSSFDRISLVECYKSIFLSARVECGYIGSENADTISRLLNEFFAQMPDSLNECSYGYTAFQSDKDLLYAEEIKNVTQGRLSIGMSCGVVLGDNDYYAMSVFNEIFGGASTSKLFMNVREKKSLCYYCNSVYHLSKGAIFVSCGVNPDNKDEAYNEIMHQLDMMKNGEITADEIKTAKKMICGSLRQVTDSTSGIDGYAFRRAMAGLDESTMDTIEKINAVSYDDIVRVARLVEPKVVYFLRGEEEADG